jgi:hypothetical protein
MIPELQDPQNREGAFIQSRHRPRSNQSVTYRNVLIPLCIDDFENAKVFETRQLDEIWNWDGNCDAQRRDEFVGSRNKWVGVYFQPAIWDIDVLMVSQEIQRWCIVLTEKFGENTPSIEAL